ncbi:hypothetical protein G7Y79_00075g099120 [Physcia stellaris]|nr:hypothetical protein G7Y79_00075g099120 [Physcia stellaris]
MAQVTLSDSQSAKVTDISSLPLELLIDSLRWLDVKSLKEARLTCRRWGEAGAHSLYHRLYFAPRKDVMKEFTEITNKPAFAANVTEVVYDARMFWSHAATRPAYDKAFFRGFPSRYEENESSDEEMDDSDFDEWCRGSPSSHEGLAASHQRYASLLKEQTSIIASGQDLIALCAGMKQLPNVEWISILDKFRSSDYSPFLWDYGEWSWYHDRSNKSMEGIAKPARWRSARLTRNELENHPWDFKGIENLFQAVFLHAPNIKKFVVGCQMSNLSTEIFRQPAAVEAMSKIAPQLTMIKLDCTPSRDESSPTWIEGLTRIFHQATKLNELFITLNRSLDYAQKLFENRKWPHLKILDLGDGEVDLDLLKAISHSHADVLRELRLRNNFLVGPKDWKEAAAELGKILKLDLVALSSMDVAIAQATARWFMQRVPNSDLGMVGDGGFVVAWHKQNYTKMSGFIEIFDEYSGIEVEDVRL